MTRSPFKWIGGKSRLRKQIIDLLPIHSCYVEVFGGAGWVLLGKPPSSVEIFNDIDQELISFFRVVKERPHELIESFKWDLVSRSEFERLAQLDTTTMTEFERAHRFYYLIMAAWGGELNYPRLQTAIHDAGHGNRLIGALKHLEERLLPVHQRLSTVIIECLDWRTCINRYDREGVVMYLDPPYPDNGCNYAHNMRSWDEHLELATRLRSTKCMWIYSSYDIPELHKLFAGYHIVPVQSASGMRKQKHTMDRVINEEILVLNYDPTIAVGAAGVKDGAYGRKNPQRKQPKLLTIFDTEVDNTSS